MALDAKKVYGALTTYVNESLIGVGALKGSNCTIKSIVHQDGVNTITFEWTANDGTKRENVMQVYDGTPIYVWESGNTYHYGDLVIYESEFYRCVFENSDVTFDRYHWQEISSKDGDYDIVPTTNELPARFTSADKKMYFVYTEAQFYFWDGTAWISQTEAKQLVTMPTASATWVNRTVQFIGTTDANYTHGFFYECVENSGSYSWVNVATTDLSGKVDKETGKGLSTNDFTNTYKNQLDSLGTSSTKDYTNTVEEGSNDLPTSNAVYNAINIAEIIKDDSTEIDYKLGVNNGLLYIETVEDGGDTNE